MFTAASTAISKFSTVLYDNDIIDAAIWCLAKDERDNEDLQRLRQSALELLQSVAQAQIKARCTSLLTMSLTHSLHKQDKHQDEFSFKTDHFDLKDCVVAYLKNLAKKDSPEIQVSMRIMISPESMTYI